MSDLLVLCYHALSATWESDLAVRPDLFEEQLEHLVRRGGRLAALVPLERRAGVLRSLANWHTPVFEPLAEDESALAELMRGLVTQRAHHVSLWFMDAGWPGGRAARAEAESTGCRMRVDTLERSPYVTLDGDWDGFMKRLTSKRRSNLRRLRRKLEERGRLEFELSDGTDRLDALLAEGFEVERSGWKGREGTAIASEPATRRFYEEVARWAVARGALRLAFLRLAGRAVAFDFCVEEGGVHYLLKTGFDEAERSLAPGVILREEMLRRAFSEGLESYEFLGDQVDWKREWTEATHELIALEAFPPTVAGRASWLAWAYARPAFNRARGLVRR